VPAEEASRMEPRWARYVAGVIATTRPTVGGWGTLRSTLPPGAGLSSSAALCVAVALALGFEGGNTELALACQAAEQLGSGVPCGVMDQLASVSGVAGSALLIDCATLSVTPIALPAGIDVIVMHSGKSRSLDSSSYAERRAECEAVEALLGPLRQASPADVERIPDPVMRRRARHVVSENQRVVEAAAALQRGDVEAMGKLMQESHRSLRDDFEVSSPALEAAVEALNAVPGVMGVRLTGAGFGGCVVGLAPEGALADSDAVLPGPAWVLHAAAGAHVEVLEEQSPTRR
jgi:galactokinase